MSIGMGGQNKLFNTDVPLPSGMPVPSDVSVHSGVPEFSALPVVLSGFGFCTTVWNIVHVILNIHIHVIINMIKEHVNA